MPRKPAFKTSSIRDLLRQLTYTPEETLERIMLAAEALVSEIDVDRVYPEEFVIFRLTRFRVERPDEPVMLVGAALMADLSTFVQELSARLDMPAFDERRGTAFLVESLATRLDVSSRTLRRYHQRGLMFHFVRVNGDQRLACYERALEQFIRRHPGLVSSATKFSRIDSKAAEAILREAHSLLATTAWSRQQVARRLAKESGRSVEAVRALLARDLDESKESGHRVRHRSTAQERRYAWRCWQRGVDLVDIAARLNCDVLTARRSVNRLRVQRIHDLDLKFVPMATFDLPEAEEVILSPDVVRTQLRPPCHLVDVLELLDEMNASAPSTEVTLEARIAGHQFLKRRIVARTGQVPRTISDARVDVIESDLRWACLIKRSLVWSMLGTALVRIEQFFSRPLIQQDAETIRQMLRLAVSVSSATLETVDLTRGQRPERVVALAMDRALARCGQEPPTSRAGARHALGSILIDDPLADVSSGQQSVELAGRYLARLDRLDDDHRLMMTQKYGLSGARPMTHAEIASCFTCSARTVAAMWRRSIKLLRRA